jgi:hypothetical protein
MERPEPVRWLTTYLDARRLAHQVISDRIRQLRLREHDPTQLDELLAESARITLIDIPGITGTSLQLVRRWGDESLLATEEAEKTLQLLSRELDRIRDDLEHLRQKQREIAAQLQAMLRQ